MSFIGALAIVASLLGGDLGGRPPEPARHVPGRLLVKFEDATPGRVAARSLARVGARAVGTVPRLGVTIVAVEAGRESMTTRFLGDDPAVDRVERDVTLTADTTPNDSFWTAQVGSQEISTPGAWDLTQGSPSTLVAVLDSGVDAGHPDLAGSTRPGYDFVNNDGDAADDNGHGTEAAGVVAARGNNSTGVAGVCWVCSILPVKVLGPTGEGTTAALASGIVWAADHGARVINMSLSGPGTTKTLTDAVSYAASRGVVLVASAGNDGSTTPTYPAAYPEVIAVAATTPAKTLYAFSNRGDWVRLAAPACNPSPFLAGAYMLFCGTSSSAPLVSGVAALAISLRPAATKAVVDRALERSAKPIADPGVRYGQVDALGALHALEETFGPSEAASGGAASPPPSATAAPVSNARPQSTPKPRPVAPAAVRAPSVAGRVRVGRPLRARRGTWTGTAPMTFRYRWYRCRSRRSGCTPIRSAAGLRYRPARRDRGLRIRFSVTAKNAAGVAFRISRPTARVPVTP
jgi:subtilisin family serine protease